MGQKSIRRQWVVGSVLLGAGCQPEGCQLPEPPALQVALQVVERQSGQDLFAPGSGTRPDSARFYEVLPTGNLAPKAVTVQRTGSSVRFGPLRLGAGAESSISVPGSSLPLAYTDVLVRLSWQDTDTLTIVTQRQWQGGDECGQLVPARLQFYYNGRLNATYSLAAPDSLRTFTVPALPQVVLRK